MKKKNIIVSLFNYCLEEIINCFVTSNVTKLLIAVTLTST